MRKKVKNEKEQQRRAEIADALAKEMARVTEIRSPVKKYRAIQSLLHHLDELIRDGTKAEERSKKSKGGLFADFAMHATGMSAVLIAAPAVAVSAVPVIGPVVGIAAGVAVGLAGVGAMVGGVFVHKKMDKGSHSRYLASNKEWTDMLRASHKQLCDIRKDMLENHMTALASDPGAEGLMHDYPELAPQFASALMQAQKPKRVVLPKPKPQDNKPS
ncbi:MAG: hypothetical protein OXT65_11650 [Alphaproteobacteria bacterium]|nr:hypothetical protein [Alphaproteobacteria bacterium]